MNLFGTRLTRMLAAVAAVLTVFAGVPQFRCVCPDGRAKFFYCGFFSSACCCAQPQFAAAEAAADDVAPCCTHRASPSNDRRTDRDSGPPRGDETVLGQKCGCKRALVSEAGSYVVEEVAGAVGFESAVVIWETIPAIPARAFFSGQVPPPLLPPLDRLVLFCHFTC
ncbi:MAG: hypothetical protein K2V38_20220 [Gemmataceae bacterium]|nr:hypothetical protein [Gemmataceae bacterium]